MNFLRTCATVPEIRNRLLLTIAFLALYRLGSHLPAPGVDASAILALQQQFQGSLSALNFLSSSGQGQFSLFALGVMPVIMATVIIQMLASVIPSLHRLQKSGQAGRAKITQYTRYLTVAIAIVQAVGQAHKLSNLQVAGVFVLPDSNVLSLIVLGTALVAGAVVIMLLGELITRYGIANGTSLLVFASIAATLPSAVETWVSRQNVVWTIIGAAFAVLMIVAVVYIQKSYKKIPVAYGRDAVSSNDHAASMTYMPVPLNAAGVIPVIFAGSLLGPLSLAIGRIGGEQASAIQSALTVGHWPYLLFQTVLIVFFAYFYTALTVNPVERADELRFAGGYVVGTTPGRPTVYLLDHFMTRLTLPGALFLALVVAVPSMLLPADVQQLGLSGMTVVILVGVALEAANQLKTRVMIENYDRKIVVEN